jgi:hypothetical protein
MHLFNLFVDALMDDVDAVSFLQSGIFGNDHGFGYQLFSHLVDAKPSMFIVFFFVYIDNKVEYFTLS